ncbi:MAG: membrane dipeptidase [Clostridia bacterium]|nr:membrane dipeptidase [Clostridia bacterium]
MNELSFDCDERLHGIGLCDLHCDTLLEMAQHQADFYDNSLHLGFDRVHAFSYFLQVMAIWSNTRLSDDDCYAQFLSATAYMKERLCAHPEITQCRCGEDVKRVKAQNGKGFILAVEGGNLLSEDVSRLDEIYARGVRFFTLVWGGESRMGGAHDVGGGLSPFGVKALKRMFALGIVPDVSHASKEIFYQTAAYADDAGKPFVATHSNSAAVWNHTRCLTDEQFRMIRDSGGIVGVSFCTPHLGDTAKEITIGTVVDHIEHYLSLGGEKTVCFGGDLDGIGSMPTPMTGVESLPLYYEEMAKRGFGDDLIYNIFCGNAQTFFEKNL